MTNDALQPFQVKILGLANGRHTLTVPVSDAFFTAFEHSLVRRSNLQVQVQLDRSETLIRVHFAIDGTIELESDRSLDAFDYPISLCEELIYKFGDEEKELSEEMQQIPWEAYSLDLSQPVYEFIMLAVPMRKLKPDEQEEPEEAGSDDERRLIYRSGGDEPEEGGDTPPDPQWEALRKLFPN